MNGALPISLSSPDPSIYLTDDWLCLDVETTNIEYGSALNAANRLILASVYGPKQPMRTFVGDEFHQKELIDLIKKHKFIVAHNVKFELQWLARCGMDLHNILCYDTMLGEWVLLGNRKEPKDLNSTAQRYGVGEKEDGVAKLIKMGVNPLNIPIEWLSKYCEQDVRITSAVFAKQRELLLQQDQLHLIYSRCLAATVLADIEGNGVTLDKERVLEEYNAVKEERDRLQYELDGLADSLGHGAINWRSGKQVGEFLYDTLKFKELTRGCRKEPDRTEAGKRKTDSPTIEKLKATTANQRSFKSLYKSLTKANARLTKSLEFFKTVVEEYDGTFFGVFNQGVTVTHRLSSNGRKIVNKAGDEYSAQLQNLPREYKRLVRAKKDGWQIAEVDASGLEFRVAIDLGKDEIGKQEVIDGADIHQNTFDALSARGFPPKDRTDAKKYTFKPLYGGLGVDGTAERAYSEFFQEKYKQIFNTQTQWTYEVLKNKCLITTYGMRFYWPYCKVNGHGSISNTTEIFNYPVQGFATGEIIPIVLVHAWHALKDWNVRIVLTVHDSIVLEVAPDVDVEALKKLMFWCFTTAAYEYLERCYGYKMWCPLGAEFKIGEHWGEGKGEKYQKLVD